MKITGVESFVLNMPVGSPIADSKRSVSTLEIVGVLVSTDDDVTGTGYTITVGHGGAVLQSVIDTLFAGDLLGEDPHDVRAIWAKLYSGKALWIGRAGATTMAQAAIDIALWDIIAKAAGQPLWRVLGGAVTDDMPIYNTHAGWLNYSVDQLCDEARTLLDQGYTALKMKVGRPSLREDIERVDALRAAVGDNVLVMADANQAWDVMNAKRAAALLAHADLSWLEEPLHPDDVRGHAELRQSAPMPIALGEHVYSPHAFQQFIEHQAVDVVQADVCRVGGVTPWLEVAAVANAAGLRVCPHAGDLMQVHQHLVRAIPNSWLLEVIPIWERGPFRHQIVLEDGVCRAPMEPGASSDITEEAMASFRVS